MKCAACGAEVPHDASFCSQCGLKVGAAPPTDSPGKPFTNRLSKAADDPEPEQELWTGGYSGKAMIGSWILAGLATIALIVVAVLFLPSIYVVLALIALIWIGMLVTLAYRKLNIRYELTSQRFVHRTGILTQRTDRIEAIDIDDVTYQQGIVERMLGVGTIRISSSDRTHPELVLIGIDGVKRIAELIDETRRKERRRRGVHIETI
jgi:uncharacterized membrane protein YdbT with pleckstrin-like domain